MLICQEKWLGNNVRGSFKSRMFVLDKSREETIIRQWLWGLPVNEAYIQFFPADWLAFFLPVMLLFTLQSKVILQHQGRVLTLKYTRFFILLNNYWNVLTSYCVPNWLEKEAPHPLTGHRLPEKHEGVGRMSASGPSRAWSTTQLSNVPRQARWAFLDFNWLVIQRFFSN